MKRLIQQRALFRQNMLATLCVCLSMYFAYHLIAGDRSALRYMSLQNQITQVSEEYTQISQDRAALEQKVVMMRPGTIDRDLLEEQVRKTLGYARSDEKVIFIN